MKVDLTGYGGQRREAAKRMFQDGTPHYICPRKCPLKRQTLQRHQLQTQLRTSISVNISSHYMAHACTNDLVKRVCREVLWTCHELLSELVLFVLQCLTVIRSVQHIRDHTTILLCA